MSTETEDFLGIEKQGSSEKEAESPASSGWAILFKIFGALGIIPTFIFLVNAIDEEEGFANFAICLAVSLQMFFAGFVIDVLTDMRWYLKKMANNHKD
ncbi:hypothetical protein N8603_00895 [Verrucomicrobiales bacterium]|nr:hypothetical protein [Verrucomicrobiales bacterium]